MPNLTVVFEYPDGAAMIEAKRLFNNGSIPNLVGIAEYDAITAHDNLYERFLGDKTKENDHFTPGDDDS